MQVWIVPVTPFQQNCSILRCEATGKGAVVDPGGDLERIEEVLREHDVQVEKILLTHGHVDHASAATELARRLQVPIEGPGREDLFWLESLPMQASTYGLGPAEVVAPDRWLEQGDTVSFGEVTLEVLHTPGHTPGHVVFFEPESRLVIVGDVLFQGSIGRTDFPRGDYDTLIRSIQERLLPLGDDVRFLPGHGPGTTLGEERRTNPFLLNPAAYRGMM
jgi:hydroxyacylglutathione hydrolase